MREVTPGQWFDALRSGRYMRGYRELKGVDDDGNTRHCCLGVLADLCDVDGRGGQYLQQEDLPAWWPRLQGSPYSKVDVAQSCLAQLNDDALGHGDEDDHIRWDKLPSGWDEQFIKDVKEKLAHWGLQVEGA